MQYDIHTANRLRAWFQYFRSEFIHIRIMKAIFKSAWKESRLNVGIGENPLSDIRMVRSAMWWEGVKTGPVKRRRLEGLFHTCSGHRTAWEDCLVIVFGVDWRSFRDGHRSLEQWMGNFAHFSNRLCELWHLPELALQPREPWRPLGGGSVYDLENTPMPDLPSW